VLVSACNHTQRLLPRQVLTLHSSHKLYLSVRTIVTHSAPLMSTPVFLTAGSAVGARQLSRTASWHPRVYAVIVHVPSTWATIPPNRRTCPCNGQGVRQASGRLPGLTCVARIRRDSHASSGMRVADPLRRPYCLYRAPRYQVCRTVGLHHPLARPFPGQSVFVTAGTEGRRSDAGSGLPSTLLDTAGRLVRVSGH